MPSAACVCSGLVLLLTAALERGQADVRERQNSSGAFGLRVGVQQVTADALELPVDVQFGGGSADVVPGEAEDLTTAQAEHEDQDVGGLERVAVVLRGFQEPASLVYCPGFTALFTWPADPREGSRVAREQLLGHRVVERRPQHVARGLDGSR